MRRSAVPVVVAAVLLIAGCGGSSGSGSAKAATSPSAAASEAPLTVTDAHAIAVASQVQTADLPGFTEDKKAGGDAKAPDATDKEVQACISGSQGPNYLADVNSSDFTKGAAPTQLTVSTETQVVATSAQAKHEYDTLLKPETTTCLNAALQKAFTAQAEGGTFEGTLKRVDTTEDYGSDGAARFVLSGAFKAQGVSIQMHVDLDQLIVGRAELTLSALAIGDQPLPSADRDRILKAVVERARAAQKA